MHEVDDGTVTPSSIALLVVYHGRGRHQGIMASWHQGIRAYVHRQTSVYGGRVCGLVCGRWAFTRRL